MKGNLMDTNIEQDTIRELSQRKQVRAYAKQYSYQCGKKNTVLFPASERMLERVLNWYNDVIVSQARRTKHWLLYIFFKNLMLELKNYEENQKAARMDRPSGLGELDQQQMGIIPVRSFWFFLFMFYTRIIQK